MAEVVVTPFTPAELHRLHTKVSTAFVEWAVMQPSVRPYRGLKDTAAIHAWLRLEQAQSSYSVFNKAVKRGASMDSLYRGYTFAQHAGTAAGHLAASKLVTVWYGLRQADIERVPAASDELRVIAGNCELLEPTIGRLPQTLGIVDLSTYDIFSQAKHEATEAATLHGHSATEAFFEFPQFPAWASFNPIHWTA